MNSFIQIGVIAVGEAHRESLFKNDSGQAGMTEFVVLYFSLKCNVFPYTNDDE
jgi:hypothetical protein